MVADTYLNTLGDIKEMLRVILQKPVISFLTTPKITRPFHMVVALLRASDAEISSAGSIRNRLSKMSHEPFE